MIFLCNVCAAANAGSGAGAPPAAACFPPTTSTSPSSTQSSCFICHGKALHVERMLTEANGLLSEELAAEAALRTFSISTIIPKDWLTNEESAWDVRMANSRSIKDYLNSLISSSIHRQSGLRYSSDGDCRIVFDFSITPAKVTFERNNLFVFGRYKKLVAGLSQSRWICAKCSGTGGTGGETAGTDGGSGASVRTDGTAGLEAANRAKSDCPHCKGLGKNYESVEERIGEPLKKATGASDYALHASGREDVDATNTAGRPFVMELKAPKNRGLSSDVLVQLAKEIAAGSEVGVESLRVVPRAFVEVVTESHFDKEYDAEVEFGRSLTEDDRSKILALEGKTLLQQTPQRVAHRRADLVRHRKVRRLVVKNMANRIATITINAEAGTYIKEFISGDNGRTKPSISETLGTTAICKKLVVTKIEDGFLDLCLPK